VLQGVWLGALGREIEEHRLWRLDGLDLGCGLGGGGLGLTEELEKVVLGVGGLGWRVDGGTWEGLLAEARNELGSRDAAGGVSDGVVRLGFEEAQEVGRTARGGGIVGRRVSGGVVGALAE
jgi:hypothetical protein